MPAPIISDNISAPRAAPNPRSVQYATMCTCGMAMATQQPTPATHNRNCNTSGCRPSGRCGSDRPTKRAVRLTGAAVPAGWSANAGGRRRSTSASGNMVTMQKMPRPM